MAKSGHRVGGMARKRREREDRRRSHSLMGFGPSYDQEEARGGLDDVPATSVARLVKKAWGWRRQIALAQHAEPPKRKCHSHGRAQVPQRGREKAKRVEKGRKYREAPKRGYAQSEVGGPKLRGHLEGVQRGGVQTQLLVEESDPG